jgi:hypothetical protein
MGRLLALTALVAAFVSGSDALAARPDFYPVQRLVGVWRVEYGIANGPDGRAISAAQYEDFRRSGSCGSNSHISVWPTQKLVTIVCEV